MDDIFIRPAAQGSYDTYMEHLRQCRECPRGSGRCADGQELVRVYLGKARTG
ncbi:hypothetical protein [Streptomyces sp. GQFP]|uniref:hypothetical protein n=1 Tax=Streptomyces sp. GQFP TaxID=2907545 RepID=UPI001F3CBEFA|nr:hypothetical protein [Streptomyces sp. GQFP]UIX34220.1 hypothetical protein LUX31_31800 [Streptomyces sp. GQFP]